jgi:hypothetical protein
MLKEDVNTKRCTWLDRKTSVTSWIGFLRMYRNCRVYIDQYDVDWSYQEDGKEVKIPKGYCNLTIYADAMDTYLGYRHSIPEDMIDYVTDQRIGQWLRLEMPYVFHLNEICKDSVITKERDPAIRYIPDNPETWVVHDDTELKHSNVPAWRYKQAFHNFNEAMREHGCCIYDSVQVWR